MNQGRSQEDLEASAEACAWSGAGLILTLIIVLICGACNAGNAPQLDRIDEGAAKELSVFWPQVEITYQYEDGVPAIAREAMIAALAEWRTEWPHYRYREVFDGGNVLIRWDKSDDEKLADTTITLSNDGKHIAHALIVINSRHRWPHPIFSLARTLAHEWGHALGLGHSANKGDIMYPVQVIGPTGGDVEKLRKLMRGGN
jgi:hypothetical protein